MLPNTKEIEKKIEILMRQIEKVRIVQVAKARIELADKLLDAGLTDNETVIRVLKEEAKNLNIPTKED